MKRLIVEIDEKIYMFYNAVSKSTGQQIEAVLSDTLYKIIDILTKEMGGNSTT